MDINNKENIERIFSTQHIKQKSPEWFKMRKLTASSIGYLLKKYHFAKYILEQSSFQKKYEQNIYTCHGINFEDLSQQFYKYYFNPQKVHEISLVQHPDQQMYFIGASPDGFVVYNENGIEKYKLLEIKSTYSRQILPCSNSLFNIVPELYVYQSWLQLECCQMDLCDFWQTKIQQFETKESLFLNYSQENTYTEEFFYQNMSEYYKKQKNQKIQIRPVITFADNIDNLSLFHTLPLQQIRHFGCYIELKKMGGQEFDLKFILDLDLTTNFSQDEQKMQELMQNYILEEQQNGFILIDQTCYVLVHKALKYWRFEYGHLIQIRQNKSWFQNNKKKFLEAWDIIQKLKANQEVWKILNDLYEQEFEVEYKYQKNENIVQEKYNNFIQQLQKYSII